MGSLGDLNILIHTPTQQMAFLEQRLFYIFAAKHSKISGKDYVTVEEDAYTETLLIWQLTDETHTLNALAMI